MGGREIKREERDEKLEEEGKVVEGKREGLRLQQVVQPYPPQLHAVSHSPASW